MPVGDAPQLSFSRLDTEVEATSASLKLYCGQESGCPDACPSGQSTMKSGWGDTYLPCGRVENSTPLPRLRVTTLVNSDTLPGRHCHRACAPRPVCVQVWPDPPPSVLSSVTMGRGQGSAGRWRGASGQGCAPALSACGRLTRVAWLEARAEGPITMLTLLDDWVSLLLPPSAAESPEMTRALEKPLLPKRKLSVELVDEPRLDLTSASARSRTLRWPALVTGGGWACRAGAEVRKDSRLPARRGASPWADADVCRAAWRLSGIGPDVLRAGGLWPSVPCAWMDRLRPFLPPLKESRAGYQATSVSVQ